MSEGLQYTKYYASDPDWLALTERYGYHLRQKPHLIRPLSVPTDREAQLISEGEWTTQHPLSGLDYESHISQVESRDGIPLEIKVYRSSRVPADALLPLLFITPGDSWIRGTHVTEEAWLLWPLLKAFDLVVVSVNYRSAPEHTFPTITNDCWDALQHIVNRRGQELNFDASRIIIAGSGAGGCLCAILSQRARDAGLSIKGVILNVPVTCDPRHFPVSQYEYTSYDQCYGTLLSGEEMELMWKLVVPDEKDGGRPSHSPLLGDVTGVVFDHIVYIAGQDPLRDEGIAYAKKLEEAGVNVTLRIYPGVPHSFGEFWELSATKKWWDDLRNDLGRMIA